MARQGKLHSSPFHIESRQYKYAIEHEVEPFPVRPTYADCPYLDRNRLCSLWNSGNLTCNGHKCAFAKNGLRRSCSCEKCAFFFMGSCFEAHKPLRDTVVGSEAEYCTYFIGEEDDPKRYRKIQFLCKRYYFTSLVKSIERQIQSKDKYVAQAKAALISRKKSEETVRFYTEKIASKEEERKQLTEHLKAYKKKLISIGGKLDSLPWFASSHRCPPSIKYDPKGRNILPPTEKETDPN